MKKGREPLVHYGYPYNTCDKACGKKGLFYTNSFKFESFAMNYTIYTFV